MGRIYINGKEKLNIINKLNANGNTTNNFSK